VVAHLVRLKLALLRNGLRRSVWRLVGLLLGAAYVAFLLVTAVAGLLLLGSRDDPELARTVLVLGGTVLVAGWWLLPLVAFGVDSTLDPDRFRLLPVPRRPLLTGLALAGLVGLPGAGTALLAAATPLVWWRSPVAAVAALAGAALGVALCVVGSRAVTTLLAPLVTGRRFREAAAVLLLVPLILSGPILLGVSAGLAAVADALPDVAGVVAWTPLGAPWAVGADVAAGSWGAALGRLAVAGASLAVAVAVWDRALSAALVRPEGGARAARSAGLGFFGRLPATPTGAVAARCLTYWFRDARYAAAVAVVPVLVLLLWFLGRGSDSLLVAGPLVAFVMGWSLSADVSYDHTAFWTHVAAPVDGRVDRTGRAVAGLVVGSAAVLVVTVISLAVTGRWDAAVPVLGAAAGVLLIALGTSSVYSAQVVYPVPKPGESPFTTPQGSSFALMVSQCVGMVALAVLCLPAVVPAVVAVATGPPLATVLAAVVGPALGVAVLVAGIRIGARVYDRRAPELLATIRSFA